MNIVRVAGVDIKLEWIKMKGTWFNRHGWVIVHIHRQGARIGKVHYIEEWFRLAQVSF
jgi:hypothetical protein